MSDYSNLIEIIFRNARENPTGTAYQWLEKGEYETDHLSFSELRESVKQIASCLGQRINGSDAHKKVVLMLEPSLDFIKALFGCMAARHIAIPVSQIKPNGNIFYLKGVLEDCDADIIITSERYQESLREIIEKLEILNLEITTIKELTSTQNQKEYTEIKINSSETAFYQYTSGSTGSPKGVEITHQNIMINQEMIKESFCHDNTTIFVGWLPLYHDMGLIGNVMQPMYLGISCYLMSPLSFVQKPIRWLNAISKYRATTSGGPNFGYELCVKRIAPSECAHLDLSNWSVAYNGSEPVRSNTLAEFSEKFEAYGFNKNAHFPCYGMAEATLFIAGDKKPPVITSFISESLKVRKIELWNEISGRERTTLVGCGTPSTGQELAIVDPDSLTALQDGEIGEIWVKGGNIAKSYLNKPKLTAENLYAKIRGNEINEYLRTGDLGFIYNGELYVTGRIKDLIIIRGKNHYPHDIEHSVASLTPEFDTLSSVAIYDENSGSGRLIVLQEVNRKNIGSIDTKALEKQARKIVTINHDIALDELILLKPNSIPKTTSGKVKRSECLRRYKNKEFCDRMIS